MNHKNLLLLVFCVLISSTLSAQNDHGGKRQRNKLTDATIVGDVQCNGEHVPFINITLDGTTIGTTTDATGHYQLNHLPIGSFTLRVSGIGYKPTTQTIQTVANKTQEFKFVVEEDVLQMEEVVVSADRNKTNRKEAPVVITTVSPVLFTQTQSLNLAEGLCFTPGVRTECNCQNCGFTQLRMNGLDGPYTQILVNSRPVFSGLAGVYGLELIPANMIERLEIVRGGGSALFGGNAIAGTVNVITKESKTNSFSLDGRYGMIGLGHEDSNPAADAQYNMNASVVSDDNKTGAYIYSMFRDRESFDENGDGYSEMVSMENTTFGFNAFHKTGTRSKLTLDGYRINEFRRGGNKEDYLPHETDITEQLEHNITSGSLAFDWFSNDNYDKLTLFMAAQQVDRDSYYGAMKDPDAYGKTVDFSSSAGGQYIINAEHFLFAASTTVLGVENNHNHIFDQKLGSGGKPNSTLTKQSANTLGGFVQQDWKGRKINLSMGLRVDNYQIKDLDETEGVEHAEYQNTVFVPRFSVLYKIQPNLRWRIGYGKGYRAPQVFNEDLHIELITAKRVIHLNDPDLVQEVSHAFTSSVNANFGLGNSAHALLAEGFYTRLQNPFADEYYKLEGEDDSWANMRVNAEDGAFVGGINLELSSYWSPRLSSELGFTYQKSRYDSPQTWGEEESSTSSDFIRTPNSYGYASLEFDPKGPLNLNMNLNYTGSMLVPHFGLDPATTDPLEQAALANGEVIAGERLEESEQFYILDLLISYDIPLSREFDLQIYAGVKNIFDQTQSVHDKGMFRDAGYIYGPCMPRTLNLGIKVNNFFH